MRISKSLFVEFIKSPKAARYYVNDKAAYQRIRQARYGAMDGASVGDQVEECVIQLLYHRQLTINSPHGEFFARVKPTQQLIVQHPDVLYQGRFATDDLLCAVDFLIKNEQGTYDLWEVKAKNTVRKGKENKLLPELIDDLSFQRLVLQQTMGESFSGKVKLVYLNSDYIKSGPLQLQELLIIEDVTSELMTPQQVQEIITTMQDQLGMSEEWFNQLYPYEGSNYLEYFGEEVPRGSIWMKSLGAVAVKSLYERGQTDLLELTELDQDLLKKKDGSPSQASHFVKLYQQAETVIDTQGIMQELDLLNYPLYFYDYETICTPIPFIEGSSPWQQIVVQYSIHKVESEGTISHREGIIKAPLSTNQSLVDQLIQDLDQGQEGSFIVRNESFEKTRNLEMSRMYPQYATTFSSINAQTYDLMNIFKDFLYFDRRFQGSASIKKVLPVLTDINYENLEIDKGDKASQILLSIATGALQGAERDIQIQHLLSYCQQDTWAMVRIWQELHKSISL